MAKRIWNFTVANTPHEILLKHGPIPGREIWLDGSLIEKGRVRPDVGSEHYFSIEGHPAEIGIVAGMFGFDYYLRIDDQFVFSKNDPHQSVGRAVKRKFEERDKWIAQANKYGLTYSPLPLKPFVYRHRLIGYAQGFPILVSFGFKNVGGNSIPGIYMIIRHSTIDAEKGKELRKHIDIKMFLKESKVGTEFLEITSSFTSLFLSTGLKKESELATIDRLFTFFRLIIKIIKPPMQHKCEGAECKSPYSNGLQLVLINGIPYVMCEDCIGKIGDIGKKIEKEYKEQPDNLLKGMLYGSAGMLLGATIWALVMVFLDRIGALFAVFTFLLVIKSMDYAKTKRTFKSLLIASILSFLGSIIGTYLGAAGYLLKEGLMEWKLSEFIQLAQMFVEDPELLSDTFFFTLLGLIPYLYITWQTTRKGLKQYFNPDVEVLSRFDLKKTIQ